MYDVKKTSLLTFSLLLLVLAGQAQLEARLAAAYARFESDTQLRHALSSLYVIDAASGKAVFARGETIGMAAASTLKVVTAATAFDLLGAGFHYETAFGYSGSLSGGVLKGSLHVRPSGDPTLGSWRWPATRDEAVLQRIAAAIRRQGIASYDSIIIDDAGWVADLVPDAWIWQDIGNYYGAGAHALDWRENQYDVLLGSGDAIGEPARLLDTRPRLKASRLVSEVTVAEKGTGDRTYIYLPIGSPQGVIRGTIPAGEKAFTVSGATPFPHKEFAASLEDELTGMGIRKSGNAPAPGGPVNWFYTERSPGLDSIVYWFLRKSINLYGEALIKKLSRSTKNISTEQGAEAVKAYWQQRGIEPTELNIVDGSGLSPQDRVTTRAQATILRYARSRPWFDAYYAAFPEYNGMKMKSGTIGGVKGFCGYQHSADGHDYIFSFLVNNYNGGSGALVTKMYAVLDELKK